MARQDARRTSELVFEALYTKIEEGGSRGEIAKSLARLSRMREGMRIRLYRIPLVEALYGVVPEDKEALARDPLLQKAMSGQEAIEMMPGNRVRYLYPVKVEARCLSCHQNAKIGDVNGVIDIDMPAQDIVIFLERMIVYFIVALAFFLLFFFLVFYGFFEKHLIRPLLALTEQIDRYRRGPLERELTKRVEVATRCRELKTLEKAFNALMRQIRFY